MSVYGIVFCEAKFLLKFGMYTLYIKFLIIINVSLIPVVADTVYT